MSKQKEFNKGLFRIEKGTVIKDEYHVVMYSEDYKEQLMVQVNLRDLEELRDYLNTILEEEKGGQDGTR